MNNENSNEIDMDELVSIAKEAKEHAEREEVIFTKEFRSILYQFIEIMLEDSEMGKVDKKIKEISNVLKDCNRGQNIIMLSFLLSLHFTDEMVEKMKQAKKDEKIQDYIR